MLEWTREVNTTNINKTITIIIIIIIITTPDIRCRHRRHQCDSGIRVIVPLDTKNQ